MLNFSLFERYKKEYCILFLYSNRLFNQLFFIFPICFSLYRIKYNIYREKIRIMFANIFNNLYREKKLSFFIIKHIDYFNELFCIFPICFSLYRLKYIKYREKIRIMFAKIFNNLYTDEKLSLFCIKNIDYFNELTSTFLNCF